jgi:hypothetical protein
MFHSKRIARKVAGTLRSQENSSSLDDSPPELNLVAGDWVQVRSEKEIRGTLNEQERHKGLYFMPEMRKYCGRTLRVRKRVENIMLESNREMRRLRVPTVILEDSTCDGESSGGCDRSCYLLWREVWLKRASPPGNSTERGAADPRSP